MSGRNAGPYDSIARKWLALAERRRRHLLELRESGRWRHYYSLAGLIDALDKAVRHRDEWARIAGLSTQELEALG
jgi:hypothetical protein